MARPHSYASFLEGPVATLDGEVYVCDVRANRLLRFGPDGSMEVYREDSGRAIGNTWDLEGRLVTCEGAEHGPGGRRRLTRTTLATGAVETLVDRYEGRRLNSPNDVVCDELGRLFFTDPRYGARDDLELTHESVYRLDPDGTLRRLVTQPAVQRPNGVTVTPDCAHLYVVDSNHAPGGSRTIWEFALDRAGEIVRQRQVFDFAPGRGGDGIALDAKGDLYVCAGIATPRSSGETRHNPPGVYVISSSGSLLDVIDIPQDVITNCCFGDADLRTLFVTAGHLVFRCRVDEPGYHAGMRPRPIDA
ncbi:SMP-30/gluconolactonase/LRE family protein [Tenggerimyces flavus]|uniref:SMP-30/gluconolactonase/LRE family protein n=1 Tax=Tenggerimyces flavus TaxID=1708749 RepID=A0ABV7YMC9_9ACTN|nr:SMP-30/gluconolactonase/LRE family protein [Tenggerimyces flavus]MBM7789630.1 gluconolactonase [Tenggerimyces flavus]